MTVLGKILVFVNLVFSVLVGGLVVVVFTARTNYADALKKEQEYRLLDKGAAEAKLKESNTVRNEYGAKEAALKAEKANLEKDLAEMANKHNSLKGQVKTDIESAGQSQRIRESMQNDVARRNDDVIAAQARLDAEKTKNTQLILLNTSLTQDALTAQITAAAAEERLKNLQAQYEIVARIAARSPNAPTTSGPNNGGKNPPAEKIEGEVTRMEGTHLQLSVGSDSGLKVGHTLEIYRLAPGVVKYLGVVKITDVEPKVAVAVPLGKLNADAQVKDKVASQIR